MGWVDIVLCGPCHDIIGNIAVQHKQFNFRWLGLRTSCIGPCASPPALAGTIAQPSKPIPCWMAVPPALRRRRDYAGSMSTAAVALPIRRPVRRRSIAIPWPGSRPNAAATAIRRCVKPGRSYIAWTGEAEPLLNPPPCGAVHYDGSDFTPLKWPVTAACLSIQQIRRGVTMFQDSWTLYDDEPPQEMDFPSAQALDHGSAAHHRRAMLVLFEAQPLLISPPDQNLFHARLAREQAGRETRRLLAAAHCGW